MTDSQIIQDAIKVAKQGLPVFPTNSKKPVWSNKELGVMQGQGGYKIATTQLNEVRKLFTHTRATEIAVPMGEMSGLICVDVDIYKDEQGLLAWIGEQDWLKDAPYHETRSGGRHYFFKYEEGVKLPATLRPFVDIKAKGGFVCWLGTEGYKRKRGGDPPLLSPEAYASPTNKAEAIDASFNSASDEEVIQAIADAKEFHPALRTLSWRMANRLKDDGNPFTPDDQRTILTSIMMKSVGANPDHPRHSDWSERLNNLSKLIDSAYVKRTNEESAVLDAFATLSDGEGIFSSKTDNSLPDSHHSEPQRRKKISLNLVEATASSLADEHLAPLEWIIPNMIPYGSVVGIAGASNVGKTRLLAMLAMSLACHSTDSAGLPECREAVSTLWVANEEHAVDIKRRLKAASLFYRWSESPCKVMIHGKDSGRVRLAIEGKDGKLAPNMDMVAGIVEAVVEHNIKLVMLDPYITLSSGVDENSNAAADVISEVFNSIISATGCSILHTHHCPKENTKSDDWYAGSSSAWRGAGAIFSALDCGFTLAPYTAQAKGDSSKRAKQVGNWVMLDSAKIREGERLERVFYELVPQQMYSTEGDPIGVCRIGTEGEASNHITQACGEALRKHEVATALYERLGEGVFTNISKIHMLMSSDKRWISKSTTTVPFFRLRDALGSSAVLLGDGVKVQIKEKGISGAPRSQLVIEKIEKS